MSDEFILEQIADVKNAIGDAAPCSANSQLCRLIDLVSFVRSLRAGPGTTNGYRPVGKCIRRPPVVIVAGGTGRFSRKARENYRALLVEGFHDFSGTVISGGTTAGICGLVGDLPDIYNDKITTIGYLPSTLPAKEQADTRYHEIRKTEGEKFSVREPLQYWTDILTSGILPSDIRLIGINGGIISAAEYRIALLLGATVGILQNSGRAAADLYEDTEWNLLPNLIMLPHDGATLRAFVGFGAGFPTPREQENGE
jgi:hypothetical protein